jgi:hypothetical protein
MLGLASYNSKTSKNITFFLYIYIYIKEEEDSVKKSKGAFTRILLSFFFSQNQ